MEVSCSFSINGHRWGYALSRGQLEVVGTDSTLKMPLASISYYGVCVASGEGKKNTEDARLFISSLSDDDPRAAEIWIRWRDGQKNSLERCPIDLGSEASPTLLTALEEQLPGAFLGLGVDDFIAGAMQRRERFLRWGTWVGVLVFLLILWSLV